VLRRGILSYLRLPNFGGLYLVRVNFFFGGDSTFFTLVGSTAFISVAPLALGAIGGALNFQRGRVISEL